MLAFFRAPGGIIRALPCQAECPIGHLVLNMNTRSRNGKTPKKNSTGGGGGGGVHFIPNNDNNIFLTFVGWLNFQYISTFKD